MAIPIVQSIDFDYDLPNDCIAQYPLAERDASKLLVVKNNVFQESIYKNIVAFINPNSIMVFNNSKVIPARLIYVKPNGSIIEIFCLEPSKKTPTEALIEHESSKWICLIGGLKKWKTATPLTWILNDNLQIEAHFIVSHSSGFDIEFQWNDDSITFGEIINQLGQMPIPPYLLRKADDSDSVRYQTTYATQAGSVAAPTAGLHFTPHIFEQLEAKNIPSIYATLHVGAGTFKPVKVAHAHEHEMHAEWIDVSIDFIDALNNNKPVTAVGTTSIRTLESLYWYALQAMKQNALFNSDYVLPQFIAYENQAIISKEEAFSWLSTQVKKEGKLSICFKTQIMILPTYKFKVANQLVTNFHQPKSTLLMLISAATKGNWKPMYDYALQHKFRFLSYGDGCIIDL